MNGIDRVAFTLKFNWQFVMVVLGIVAGIAAFIMMKGSKYDRELFSVKKWKVTLGMALIPVGLVFGILLALILWAAGANDLWSSIDIYWYAVMIVLGMIAAVVFATFLAKKKGLPADTAVDIALLCIPLGILGARIWFVIFPYEGGYHDISSLKDFFDLRQGGLGIYGGVIGGAIGVIIVALWKKINIFKMLDIAAPVVMLAQAIGRWGNFFNQEAFGYEIFNEAWQWFPFGVHIGESWYLATFFYEFLWNAVGFSFLYWFAYKKNKIDGLVTCGYFLWYGLGRSWIESLRTDSLMIGSLRVSVVFSIVMILVSVGAGAYFIWNDRKKRLAAGSEVKADSPDNEDGPDDEDRPK